MFQGEAALPAGLAGSPAFQQAFQQNARRTPAGQSLKDFSLKGHLFENRCSYFIYSDSFLQLPLLLRQRVYDHLARILQPDNTEPRYAYLTGDERKRIREILRATHKELAAVFAR